VSENIGNYEISYAQNREDIILSAFFWDVEQGFYVDIGAYDPVDDSVTKYFYDRGWRGVNIEPSQTKFKKLVEARPRDINLNLGISNKNGYLTYRNYTEGQGLSTFSSTIKRGYKDKDGITKKYTDKKVRVVTLKKALDENDIPHIHFLKIDIEGHEYEALEQNDWLRYRPEIICIEANHIVKDWHELLRKHGYSTVFNDGLNEYLVGKEYKERADRFKYVEMVIGRNIPMVYFHGRAPSDESLLSGAVDAGARLCSWRIK